MTNLAPEDKLPDGKAPPKAPDKEKPVIAGKHYLSEATHKISDIRKTHVIIAFCLAVTLWYSVTVRDKVESWVDVPVVFRKAPGNLIISEGLINKVSVRVRAARGLSRGLTSWDAVVVDLSSISRGSNAVAIKPEMLPFNSAYEVVEISPSRILVIADTRATKVIPLESMFTGSLSPDFYVKSLILDPPQVIVSGPETHIGNLSGITIPVLLAGDMMPGNSIETVAVPASATITVTPPQVTVDMDIGIHTKQFKLTRIVKVEPPLANGSKVIVSPSAVTIVADIPESLITDGKIVPEMVAASVVLPADFSKDVVIMPVTVSVPKNARIVSVSPVEVTVTSTPQP
ncbi:hypothetical protein FACS1894168_2300 [Deltaproteobacteria bacterium]|nr:hypothetical protein FACS1894168_2300 [Deltaproteobacteria bacterium]